MDGGTRNIIVFASLVHRCAIAKNAIVASQLYDVTDVQFTMLYIGVRVARLTLFGLNFRNLVPNNTCWPQNVRLAFWPFSRIDLAPCKIRSDHPKGQQVLFGTKFLKFGPKIVNLATLTPMYSIVNCTSATSYNYDATIQQRSSQLHNDEQEVTQKL